jgi:hypothetical protein
MYGKSASAGGASMTPSSVAWVCAVIEVMRTTTARRRATHRSARNRRPGRASRAVEHAVRTASASAPPGDGLRFLGAPASVVFRVVSTSAVVSARA